MLKNAERAHQHNTHFIINKNLFLKQFKIFESGLSSKLIELKEFDIILYNGARDFAQNSILRAEQCSLNINCTLNNMHFLFTTARICRIEIGFSEFEAPIEIGVK